MSKQKRENGSPKKKAAENDHADLIERVESDVPGVIRYRLRPLEPGEIVISKDFEKEILNAVNKSPSLNGNREGVRKALKYAIKAVNNRSTGDEL